MTGNIDLDPSKRSDLNEGEADVLRIINEALTSQVDPATASANLASSLREHISQSESPLIASDRLWDSWVMILDVVRELPIDHPWHEILIGAVEDLRREGGPIAGTGDSSEKWEDLPKLSMYLFDKWADPTEIDGYTSEDLEDWKRFNSFAARLLSQEFQTWIVLAYWEVAAGLETPPQDVTEFECKIWVATEWLIRSGSILFQDLSSNEELDAEALASIKPGPLCEDVYPQSVERWERWQSRLVELTSSAAMSTSRCDVEAEGQLSSEEDLSDTVGNWNTFLKKVTLDGKRTYDSVL